MSRKKNSATRDRLLKAATALFAERGFHRTTARQVAERAGVNLAAANYHFGSKRALYLEVLRAQFAAIRAELARRRAMVPTATALPRMRRQEIVALLEAHVRMMCDLMIGPPPSVHSTLMLREFADPSGAVPVIVEEFMRPMMGLVEQLIAALAPELDAAAVERATKSLVAQVVFYRVARPALLEMLGRDDFPKRMPADLAAHVLDFSLGGVERLARGQDEGRRGA